MRFDSIPYDSHQTSHLARANRRLLGGVLVSLALHALLLLLQFGIPGLDLPSLEMPWKERRADLTPLRIEIANAVPSPTAKPATAIVTPIPAKEVEALKPLPPPLAPPLNGIVLIAPPPPILTTPEKIKLAPTKTVRIKRNNLPSAPPLVKRFLPPAQSPTRIIAQDLVKNDEFVVPVTTPEEVERKVEDKKENKQKLEAIPADAIIDKEAENQLIEEKRLAELAAKKILEDKLAEKRIEEKERQIAEQKEQKQEELRRQQAEIKLNQEIEQKKIAQELEESLRRDTEKNRQESARQQTEQLAQQRQAALQKIAQESIKREQQLAEAQAEKQKAQELEDRKKLEELQQQKLAEQRALEQKQLAQRLAEKKLSEQKLAEQKIAEQKLAEQKLAEQKLAEQKLAEQKLAEQKLAEQKLAEQKANERILADAASRANAERAAAAAIAGNGRSTNSSSAPSDNGAGKGAGNASSGANINSALDGGKPDLISRLREQARNTDFLKPSSSSTKTFDDKNHPRRRSFLGAYDKEVPLRMYVDSVKQKQERNGNLIYEKRSLSNVENTVLVNMVIRSDGSVEDVTILRSSGSRVIDDQARNIVLANAPYAVFPPNIAAKYDVIEVRRVWTFGDRLRILEDLP